MDTAVLERMVKIMSYMRGTGSKPGKLKKKEKQRIQQVRGLQGARVSWNSYLPNAVRIAKLRKGGIHSYQEGALNLALV